MFLSKLSVLVLQFLNAPLDFLKPLRGLRSEACNVSSHSQCDVFSPAFRARRESFIFLVFFRPLALARGLGTPLTVTTQFLFHPNELSFQSRGRHTVVN